MKKEWIALHIYYSWPYESLLREAIKPLIAEVREKGLAEKYFFIRYTEKGPHIRLRFWVALDQHQATKTLLLERLGSYLQTFPSPTLFPEQEDPSDKEKWLPNNSLHFIEYEPEYNRYGGKEAIPYAESFFEASSNAVLTAIQQNANWAYATALGTAIRMHLCFSYGMGMDLEKMKAFYEFISVSWLSYARSAYPSEGKEADSEQFAEKTKALFKAAFDQQKDKLIAYTQTFWDALQEEAEFEESWLNDWINAVRTTHQAYSGLAQKGQLRVPDYLAKTERALNLDSREAYFLFDSFIHMTNNRLGILNRDEAYLGYLIVNCLNEITSG